ncbi:hypothetical protein G5I_05630 [Acromyrmex echinatior]|uniref:Uncharacterized protein n=1 Tax=Acromyrmex echinatior TaxID=103372 RepID=F4WIV4_ACREC|nr:hypothetical protein G5I_05630 [Acromyrmex echinatior]
MDHEEKYGNPCYANVRKGSKLHRSVHQASIVVKSFPHPSSSPLLAAFVPSTIFPIKIIKQEILISSLNWIKERFATKWDTIRIFIKKCTIGVMINTLLASSYCPSSIVTNHLKYYISKHCIPSKFSKTKTQIGELLNSCTIDFEAMATMIPVLRRGTIEFLSPTCGPEEYCPVLMIGSSRQKNAPHLVLSKNNTIGISRSLVSLNYKLCDPCENVESIVGGDVEEKMYAASMLDNDDIK